MGINRVSISGNLTRDPELRTTQSGMPVMSMGVAVNDRSRNKATGEWEDYPNFVDCTMFGARAEALERLLAKGAKVSIDGRLRQSRWEQDGQKRSKIEVIVEEIEFMSRRDASPQAYSDQAPQNYGQQAPQAYGRQAYGQQAPQYAQQTYAPPANAGRPSVYDEDIPF